MNRLKDKIALIAGGSRGIGAETARLLAQEDAYVIIGDIIESDGEQLAQHIKGEYHHLDVASEEDWLSLVAKIQESHGHIDILFNNAAIIEPNEDIGPQNPEHESFASWKQVHQVNLDGVFLGCKCGISLMKERGGSIINMSSRSGIVGIPGAAAYVSSKAGVRNHTKTVALYCAQMGYNIRCNSLHPGAILRPIWDAMLGSDPDKRKQGIAQIAEGIPLRQMGEPIDVAYAVLYLASEESKYVTGIELTINGGILAGSSATPEK